MNTNIHEWTLIAETAVWPNFFLMNVFFALKGSRLLSLLFIKGYNINRILGHESTLPYFRYICYIHDINNYFFIAWLGKEKE